MFRSVRDGGDKEEFVASGLRTPFVQFKVWSLLDLHKNWVAVNCTWECLELRNASVVRDID